MPSASAGGDRALRLWDLWAGRAALTFKGHAGGVNAVAFSPDGRRLASTGQDGTAQLWRARQMGEATLREYILRTCPGTTVVDAGGDSYYFTDPEQKHPFATLVTSDAHDQASDLGRPGVFRLNVGVSKATFQSLFGAAAEARRDFTALDVLMPHPVYGKMHWVCVLNPGPATSEAVRGLLAEAYAADVRRRGRQAEPGAAADGGGT